MAPAESFSPAGSSQYSSDTMTVGDGTWDFTKNTFLLPNLMGLNFETMRYNGMGNRFSSISQYHSLILGHGIIAAITFLFIIPAAVFTARFYSRRPGYALRYHAYLQVLAVGLTTVVFVIGWFAVGPKRSLTNPHHGIGVAIYVLILLQLIGGRLVKNIRHRSLRLKVHQWSGRMIALLGIVQIPLGLTLYGSPRYLFILFAVWMAFLLLLYFIMDHRHGHGREGIRDDRTEAISGRSSRRKSGGAMGWLGPLAAGAGAMALLKGRKRNPSRSRSRSRVRSRSRGRGSEVISSRRDSDSYFEDEKFTEVSRAREKRKSGGGGGGFLDKVLLAGAAIGAGGLLSRLTKKKDRRVDDEYSAVETDTPSRHSRARRGPPRKAGTVVDSEFSEETEYTRDGRRTPLLPGPGNPVATAAALSAAESRPGTERPMTPRPSHRRGHSKVDSYDESDYSSYMSPSRRSPAKKDGGIAKGVLAGLGMGWFAKKMQDRRERKADDRLRMEEEERRAGHRGSHYTGDGFSTPTRRPSRRPPPKMAPVTPSGMTAATGTTGVTATTGVSDVSSSVFESRPTGTGYSGPPMPPLVAPGSGPPPPAGQSGRRSRSRSNSRHDAVEPADMPAMPHDPQGILHREESGSEQYFSSGGKPHRRHSSRRRREGQAAAATAAATASRLAAEEESSRAAAQSQAYSQGYSQGYRSPVSQPVSVKVKVHDDKDRNVTLRRLTEEEAAAARSGERRRRDGSVSSMSGGEGTSSRRRYRRDSSMRRDEVEAEHAAEQDDHLQPLTPPHPAFAGGKRPKDSAYYSGQHGPAGGLSAAGQTVSSIGSRESHGTWSGMSPEPVTASAADRRRRRRMERRDGRSGGTVDFS